jgi:alpha-beta hydrolase superfamily lysophospholipase
MPRAGRPSWAWAGRAASAVLLAAIGYALVCAALWFGQERLIFRSTPLAADHRFTLASDVHEGWVEVPGARLNTLHLRLPRPDGVVFFLHGNAGNLQTWFFNVDFYRRLNMDLFMLDYRGYGKSSGRIESQAPLEADVRAAWDSVAPHYAGLRRVVFGQSLGSGLAAILAAAVQPEQTVLVSAYESLQALTAEIYPWMPGRLLRYPLRTDEALVRVRGPVLLVHGALDSVIPAAHSQRLYQLVHQRSPGATLLLLPEAAHGDIHRFEAYKQAVARAVAPQRAP